MSAQPTTLGGRHPEHGGSHHIVAATVITLDLG